METSVHLNGHLDGKVNGTQREPAPVDLENDHFLFTPSSDQDGAASGAKYDALNAHLSRHSPPQQLSRDNCDRRRPQDEDNTRLKKMPSELVGKTVSPFLKEHIPGLYAPIGKDNKDGSKSPATWTRIKDPNTRFCYRHRPDSKCRRAADETKMGFIQSVCVSLSLS